MRTGLIAGVAALIVVVIFIIQNSHAANISFLGVHLVLPLAMALLLAAIAGALLMAAAGTARITQLRQIMRRDLRKARQAKQPTTTAPGRCPGPEAGRRSPAAPGHPLPARDWLRLRSLVWASSPGSFSAWPQACSPTC